MRIVIVLTALIFVGEGICFFVVYLTMLSTTQNIESNSRIITEWRAGTDVEGKGHGTVRRTVPECLWRWLSKTMNNRSVVSIPDEPLWGHSEDMIKPRSLEPTRLVVQKPKFKRMTDDGHVPNTTQGGRLKHIQHSSRTYVPEVPTTQPGAYELFLWLSIPGPYCRGSYKWGRGGACFTTHNTHVNNALKQSGSNIHWLNNTIRKTYNLHKANFFINYVLKKKVNLSLWAS